VMDYLHPRKTVVNNYCAGVFMLHDVIRQKR